MNHLSSLSLSSPLSYFFPLLILLPSSLLLFSPYSPISIFPSSSSSSLRLSSCLSYPFPLFFIFFSPLPLYLSFPLPYPFFLNLIYLSLPFFLSQFLNFVLESAPSFQITWKARRKKIAGILIICQSSPWHFEDPNILRCYFEGNETVCVWWLCRRMNVIMFLWTECWGVVFFMFMQHVATSF